MSVEQIQNRMDELADKLNDYRIRYNCYPSPKDFDDKKIVPSRVIFYKVFGGMEEAIEYAEDLWIKERFKPKKERAKRTKARTPTGFQCPFCGNYIREVDEYYRALNKTLAMRFMGLLKNGQKGRSYLDAIVDSIGTIFGDSDIAENVLIENGLQDALMRLKNGTKEVGDTCDYCEEKIKKNMRLFRSTLTKILTMRFSELLRSENGTDYIGGVLDCIHAVFGSKNPMMIKALDSENLLGLFLKRFPNRKEESNLSPN